MGLLDSKTRILDVYVTRHGRRNVVAEGGLDIAYASFTDDSTIYDVEADGSALDSSTIPTFEAMSSPSDFVSVDTNDVATLLTTDMQITSSQGDVLFGDSNDVVSSLSASLRVFELMRPLSTTVPGQSTTFTVTTSKTQLSISDLPSGSLPSVVDASTIDDIVQDWRLSSSPNFAYLPPVTSTGEPLGRYPRIDSEPIHGADVDAYLSGRPRVDVDFVESTKSNNILVRVFSIADDEPVKVMDVVRYDDRTVSGDMRTLYFVGNIIRTDAGSSAFVNLFTLVFDDA